MIELANAIDRLLQFLIIVQPAAYLGNPFTPHAELTRASSWIGHSQNKHLMPFAACAFGAVFAVVDRTLVINDRVDVALAARADGVHIGPELRDKTGETRRPQRF